jgi:hypothetical protein
VDRTAGSGDRGLLLRSFGASAAEGMDGPRADQKLTAVQGRGTPTVLPPRAEVADRSDQFTNH